MTQNKMPKVLQILGVSKQLPSNCLTTKVKLQCSCGNKFYKDVCLSDIDSSRCIACEANSLQLKEYTPEDVGACSVEILAYILKESSKE